MSRMYFVPFKWSSLLCQKEGKRENGKRKIMNFGVDIEHNQYLCHSLSKVRHKGRKTNQQINK